MSQLPTSPPEIHGAGHNADAVQVAVRDGNRLLCPCCGQVLMVLKEKSKRFTPPKMHKVHGDPRPTWPGLEKLIARQEGQAEDADQTARVEGLSPPQQPPADDSAEHPAYRADALVVPIDPQIAAHPFPEWDPPPLAPSQTTRPVKLPAARLPEVNVTYRPTQKRNGDYSDRLPGRRTQPLQEPFTQEGARLHAWAYYRLQQLAVQLEQEIRACEAQIQRLQTKLNGPENQPTPTEATMPEERPSTTTRFKRAFPPVKRHAHADKGMAPTAAACEVPAQPIQASGRGPP